MERGQRGREQGSRIKVTAVEKVEEVSVTRIKPHFRGILGACCEGLS